MRRLAMVLLMGAIILGVLATSADARRGHNNVRHATTTSRSTSTTAAVTTTTTRGTIPVDPTPFLNVLDYGAVGDGVTDDLDAIDTAMSAASAAGKDLYFPPGTYLMSDINGVPSGLTLRGDPEGDSIINGGFYLPDASRLKYLEFVPQFSRAVIIGGAGSLTTGAEVSHCTFTGDFTWTAVHAVRAADCFIMNNTFTGGVDGGNIQFNAGKGNYVTNNSITDGRTGILFLYGRTQGGGGKGVPLSIGDFVLADTVIILHRAATIRTCQSITSSITGIASITDGYKINIDSAYCVGENEISC